MGVLALNRNISSFSADQAQTCEGGITENKILIDLRKMPISKSPRNNGITKEFYETFWEYLKAGLTVSISGVSISQEQTIIKSIEKKDKR